MPRSGTGRSGGRCAHVMITLPPLPYDLNALAPTISARTLEFHHGKHHAAYVKKTNELAKARGLDGARLEEIVRKAAEAEDQALFNQAAQAWNHAFFWESMAPAGQAGAPEGTLLDMIARSFGDVERFKAAFVQEGGAHFGSGWIWLLLDGAGALKLATTHDAGNPLMSAQTFPLFTCDLWEHAYYLDHQNDRPGFLKAWLDGVCNWQFATRQLTLAREGKNGWRHPAPSMALAD
ncbi:MAG: superoxide dismutase [Hyphomonadaceae bacterium]|nr:superoxide dismutase [Hyphomonadaceae bacterium]